MRSPRAASSLSLAKPGLAFWLASQKEMFFMSSSDKAAAMPCMMAFLRTPVLYSRSCFIRYSGCCWDNLGLTGVPELPSAPWQAAHTAVNLASPATKSGLAALAGAGVAAKDIEVAQASTAAKREEARSFMGRLYLKRRDISQTHDFTMTVETPVSLQGARANPDRAQPFARPPPPHPCS